jgi:endonuclease/exonuclease/phosphatase family metal-dependent hydrolase
VARGVSAAVMVLLLGMITLVAAPGAESSATVQVLQLNICHSGIAGCFTGEAVIAKAVSLISATRPEVLSVNEACSGDVEPLRAAMGPAHAMFAAAQHRDGTPVMCRDGQQFGNIIMVVDGLSGSRGTSGRYAVQQGNNEERVWACLPGGRLTACTTHLADRNATVALAQCLDLMNRATGYARKTPTIVAGDLNLRDTGPVNVRDCDRTFEHQSDGQVQHVFATTNFTFVSAQLMDMAGTTDHPALLITFTL